MSGFGERMLRAAKLESGIYEEVEADPAAMGQAVAVVVLSSIAAGIGTVTQGGVAGILTGTVTALAGWYIWAFLTFVIGTRLLPQLQTHSTFGELLRTIGFSSAPGTIRVIGFVPGIGPFVFLAAALWMLIAMVIAVRQALDYTGTLRAVGVCAVGWLIQGILLIILFALVGGRPS